MKTYCVRIIYDCYADYSVEAESEQEAVEKAEQIERMIKKRSWEEWQDSLVMNFQGYEVSEEEG